MRYKYIWVLTITLQKFKQANVMIFTRLIDQRFKLQPVITDIGEVFII